ncbi:MAG: acyl-CoA thioester hydrolase [Thermoleophilaceae bacterium]|nr:acyl-CoA thioester hydrolase [Thermoleophilaceae bacterium]
MTDERRRDGFSTVQRVRFGDLDAMQHMNNVEFMRFFETARIDWFRDVLPEHNPGKREAFGFIFAECHIAYRAPAFFDDEIRTWIRPVELKRSSLRLEFEMRVESDGRLVADGWGALVGYDYGAGKSRPLPEDVRERIAPMLG